ncbi:MAG: glycosyltransferase [Candidatus Doudnabacteria bacterium]|nr:glycosyltransferase [Candidatus Doudnabacteria bacterium]
MKILHLIPSYLPAQDSPGPILAAHGLNRELVRRGHDLTVYTTGRDATRVIDGVKVYYFPLTFKRWYYSGALHKALAEKVKNFDLVHISSVFLAVSTLGAHYAKKNHKPYVISCHGSLMREPLQYHSLKKKLYLALAEKRNLADAAAIHFTSAKEKEEYLALGFPAKNAVVVSNCLDIEQSQGERARRDGKKIILFLGRISPGKGLEVLVEAFSAIVKQIPEAVLLIAGPDHKHYKQNIQFLISNFHLEDKILFTGMLSGQDKLAALERADVLVLPSDSESFGMAALEAMAVGVPVILTDGVGIAGEVAEAGAGLVVGKEVKLVAAAILRIFNNPDLARNMGRWGRELVSREFSCSKAAEAMAREYERYQA